MTTFKKKLKLAMWPQHQNVTNKSSYKIKKWFSKWDRTIAAITAIVIFLALLCLVIFNIKYDHPLSGKPSPFDFQTYQLYRYPMMFNINSGSCSLSQSIMTCSGINAEALPDVINTAVDDFEQDQVDGLILNGIYFKNNKIEKGWLDGIKLKFNKLTISNTGLSELGETPFSGESFQSLKMLTLSSNSISVFKKDTFSDIKLQGLEINYGSFHEVAIEENAFAGMAGTLVSLQLQNCLASSEVLVNVTGFKADRLSALRELDLRYNNLEVLTNRSFTSALGLNTLYLRTSNIDRVEPNTFDNLYLTILDLYDNRLKTLPNGSFNYIIKGITIESNPWICNCDLVWLRDLYASTASLFSDQFFCKVSTDYLLYNKVEFCPDNQTTTETTTSSSGSSTSSSTFISSTVSDVTTSTISSHSTPSITSSTVTNVTTSTSSFAPTPIIPNSTVLDITTSTILSDSTPSTTGLTVTNVIIPAISLDSTPSITSSTEIPAPITDLPSNNSLINLDCLENNFERSGLKATSSYTVPVRNQTVHITFNQQGDEGIYQLDLEGDVSNDILLWIDSKNKANINCVYNLKSDGQVSVHDLLHGATYTFCLLPNNCTTISPFDCTGLTVPLRWNDRTWIPNKDMTVAICAVCGSLLAAILISGLIVFYCIRQHPNLIKGNKRVIIVESETTDAIVMPRTYDQINYIPPSLNSYSDGYLTPKHKIYFRNRSGSNLRTVSENTAINMPSTSTSSPRGRMRRSRSRTRMKREHVTQAFNDHVYEPPPLPPNHPSEWRCNDSINSYSRV